MSESKKKATGIIRKIDGLGRVVIPVEIRRAILLHVGDPLDIYTGDDGEIIFKKHRSLNPLIDIAAAYTKTLHKALNYPVILVDRNNAIGAAGISVEQTLDRPVSQELYNLMETRKLYIADNTDDMLCPLEGTSYRMYAMNPIIPNGDICGAIVLIARKDEKGPSEFSVTDKKLLVAAADFLSLMATI